MKKKLKIGTFLKLMCSIIVGYMFVIILVPKNSLIESCVWSAVLYMIPSSIQLILDVIVINKYNGNRFKLIKMNKICIDVWLSLSVIVFWIYNISRIVGFEYEFMLGCLLVLPILLVKCLFCKWVYS